MARPPGAVRPRQRLRVHERQHEPARRRDREGHRSVLRRSARRAHPRAARTVRHRLSDRHRRLGRNPSRRQHRDRRDPGGPGRVPLDPGCRESAVLDPQRRPGPGADARHRSTAEARDAGVASDRTPDPATAVRPVRGRQGRDRRLVGPQRRGRRVHRRDGPRRRHRSKHRRVHERVERSHVLPADATFRALAEVLANEAGR